MEIVAIVVVLLALAAFGGLIGIGAKKVADSDKGRGMFYAAIGGALLMLFIVVTSKK